MTVQPIPEGFHSLTPYLSVKGAADALAGNRPLVDARQRQAVLKDLKDKKNQKYLEAAQAFDGALDVVVALFVASDHRGLLLDGRTASDLLKVLADRSQSADEVVAQPDRFLM